LQHQCHEENSVSRISIGQANSNPLLNRTTFWLIATLLLAILAGTYYWWVNSRPKPEYVTADVDLGNIERSVNVTGSINPRVTVQVGSYVSGTVKTLSCDFNTEVTAGQICAKIDPSSFQVAVDQNAAQLNSSYAQSRKDAAALAYAKEVLDRDSKLLSDGIVAQEIVDSDKNVYKQSLAQLDLDKAAIVAQQASLKSAMVNLGYTNIVSPVTGTVLTRNVDVGQTVASSLQTPTLFLIGKDLTKMQVDANVSEADVGRITVDQAVTFSVQAYPEKIFEGRVKQIRRGPITVQNVVTYDVVVDVDNPELLLFPGMTADADIVTDARENVLRVPLAAIRFTPDRAGRKRDASVGGEGNPRRNRDDNHSDAQVSHKTGDHGSTTVESRAEISSHVSTERAANTTQRETENKKKDEPGDSERHKAHRETSSENRDETHRDHRGWDHEHPTRHDPASLKALKDDKHGGESGDKPVDNHPKHSDEKSNQGTFPSSEHTVVDKSDLPPKKRSRIWVLRDGIPRPLWVTTGLDNGEVIEVLSDELKPGDKVIVSEVRPIEAQSVPVQSPLGQTGRRGLGRP
jgi:HlyD family secretion protein